MNKFKNLAEALIDFLNGLSQADVIEAELFTGSTHPGHILWGLLWAASVSEEFWIEWRGDRIIAIYGLTYVPNDSRMCCWLLASDKLRQNPKSFMRKSMETFKRWKKRYPVVWYNKIWKGNTKSIRYLKALGAVFKETDNPAILEFEL